MNTTHIDSLLKAWELLLGSGLVSSCNNMEKTLIRDPDSRINRIENPPVIFDRHFYTEQKAIQELLTKQYPEYSHIINSVPALTGYEWKIMDYIDLYFKHFHLVVKKLKETINIK